MEIEVIKRQIFQVRGFCVMLDADLASLYQVKTKVLKQAVKRNLERFPEDFMFELSQEEYSTLRSQFVTLENENSLKGKHSKYTAYAFTEQGVAMLSSVIKSKTAVQINISIMRAFVLLRRNLIDADELRIKIEELEQQVSMKFEDVYQVLHYLMGPQGQRTIVKGYRVDENL
jgi:hypothetical protein